MEELTDVELNEAVARKLGWTLIKSDSERCVYPERWYPPDMDSTKSMNFAGSIEAAWGIVEHLKDKWLFQVQDTHRAGWIATFYDKRKQGWKSSDYVSEHADTAPRAICEAFLKLP